MTSVLAGFGLYWNTWIQVIQARDRVHQVHIVVLHFRSIRNWYSVIRYNSITWAAGHLISASECLQGRFKPSGVSSSKGMQNLIPIIAVRFFTLDFKIRYSVLNTGSSFENFHGLSRSYWARLCSASPTVIYNFTVSLGRSHHLRLCLIFYARR